MNAPEVVGSSSARWAKRILLTVAMAAAGVALTTTTASAQGDHDPRGAIKTLDSTTASVKDVVKHVSPKKESRAEKPGGNTTSTASSERPAKSSASRTKAKKKSSALHAAHAPVRSLGSQVRKTLKATSHATSKAKSAVFHTSPTTQRSHAKKHSVSSKRHSVNQKPSVSKNHSVTKKQARTVKHSATEPHRSAKAKQGELLVVDLTVLRKVAQPQTTTVTAAVSTTTKQLSKVVPLAAATRPARQVVTHTVGAVRPTTQAVPRTAADLNPITLTQQTVSDLTHPAQLLPNLLGTATDLTGPVIGTLPSAVDDLGDVVQGAVVSPVLDVLNPILPGLEPVISPPPLSPLLPSRTDVVVPAPPVTVGVVGVPTGTDLSADSTSRPAHGNQSAPTAWSVNASPTPQWSASTQLSSVSPVDRRSADSQSEPNPSTAAAPEHSPRPAHPGSPAGADSTASSSSAGGATAAALDTSETLHQSSDRHARAAVVAATTKTQKQPGFSPD